MYLERRRGNCSFLLIPKGGGPPQKPSKSELFYPPRGIGGEVTCFWLQIFFKCKKQK
jgi:hypothetical protein